MYVKGELEIGTVSDSCDEYKRVSGAYLPHSCDCWVIGGAKEIQDLIDDLMEAKRKLSNTEEK